MYLPKHFSKEDEADALRIANSNSLATVISVDLENMPFVNHLPLIVEKDELGLKLIGHMSRANPQWRHFANGSGATVIFHGPQAYITPSWYKSGRDVPTWNYAVVHISGRVRLVESHDALVDILRKSTEKFEANNQIPWHFSLPDDLANPELLASAIVGFDLRVEVLKSKFKLGQNRSPADRQAILAGLKAQDDDMSRHLSVLMEEQFFTATSRSTKITQS